jgi:hypothetical protein
MWARHANHTRPAPLPARAASSDRAAVDKGPRRLRKQPRGIGRLERSRRVDCKRLAFTGSAFAAGRARRRGSAGASGRVVGTGARRDRPARLRVLDRRLGRRVPRTGRVWAGTRRHSLPGGCPGVSCAERARRASGTDRFYRGPHRSRAAVVAGEGASCPACRGGVLGDDPHGSLWLCVPQKIGRSIGGTLRHNRGLPTRERAARPPQHEADIGRWRIVACIHGGRHCGARRFRHAHRLGLLASSTKRRPSSAGRQTSKRHRNRIDLTRV